MVDELANMAIHIAARESNLEVPSLFHAVTLSRCETRSRRDLRARGRFVVFSDLLYADHPNFDVAWPSKQTADPARGNQQLQSAAARCTTPTAEC